MMLGYQDSVSENAYDFLFRFFFSIRPTDPISGNPFDAKPKKGDGLIREQTSKGNNLLKVPLRATHLRRQENSRE